MDRDNQVYEEDEERDNFLQDCNSGDLFKHTKDDFLCLQSNMTLELLDSTFNKMYDGNLDKLINIENKFARMKLFCKNESTNCNLHNTTESQDDSI